MVMTFTPPRNPDAGQSAKESQLIQWSAKFGDGYEQNSPKGINSTKRRYTLVWSLLTPEEAQAMEDFFETAQADGGSFSWQHPRDASARLWKARNWRRSFDHGLRDNLSVTFEEVFD